MANIWSIVRSVNDGVEIKSKDIPTQEEIDSIIWQNEDVYLYTAIDNHGVVYSFSIYACAYEEPDWDPDDPGAGDCPESIPCSWLCFVYDYETFSVKAVQDTPGKALAAALCLARESGLDLSSIVKIERYSVGC